MREQDVRAAAAAVREKYATLAEAEASEEWRALSRRVARWILRTAAGLPAVNPEPHAVAIARLYLSGRFLPPLPPSNWSETDE